MPSRRPSSRAAALALGGRPSCRARRAQARATRGSCPRRSTRPLAPVVREASSRDEVAAADLDGVEVERGAPPSAAAAPSPGRSAAARRRGTAPSAPCWWRPRGPGRGSAHRYGPSSSVAAISGSTPQVNGCVEYAPTSHGCRRRRPAIRPSASKPGADVEALLVALEAGDRFSSRSSTHFTGPPATRAATHVQRLLARDDALLPEAAADVGRDDPQPVLGSRRSRPTVGADEVRDLRRGVQRRRRWPPRVPLGQAGAALQRQRGQARGGELCLDDELAPARGRRPARRRRRTATSSSTLESSSSCTRGASSASAASIERDRVARARSRRRPARRRPRRRAASRRRPSRPARRRGGRARPRASGTRRARTRAG